MCIHWSKRYKPISSREAAILLTVYTKGSEKVTNTAKDVMCLTFAWLGKHAFFSVKGENPEHHLLNNKSKLICEGNWITFKQQTVFNIIEDKS